MDTPTRGSFTATESERPAVPRAWETASAEYPSGKCVHELFQEQVALTPDAVAVEFDDIVLSYAQLDARSNRLAHRLRRSSVGPGALVGVCVERGPDLVVAVLGVLKSGAAYVPLDPVHPTGRNAVLVSESAVAAIVVGSGGTVPGTSDAVDVIAVDLLDPELPVTSPPVAVGPDDLACVLFTSGSTGVPKGSASPHRAVVRTFFGQEFARFGPGETWLQCAPVSWDAMLLELWSALLHGGRCVLAPGQAPDAGEIERLVRRHRVTALWLSAGLFNVLVDNYPGVFGAVRQVTTGGESPSLPHLRYVRRTYPNLRLVHGYGPVESMVFTTWHPVSSEDVDGATVPIGTPLANTRVHLLDGAGHPVGVGAVGELFIGGDGLAYGYHRRGALTAERFVPDPYGPAGGRLFRTGDLARWSPGGALEFVGRGDRQVKIRGFRIEMDEVEAVLAELPGVRRTAVIATDDEGQGRTLVAYVVTDGSVEDAGAVLRDQLAHRVPSSMVPSTFVFVEDLPLTANGKVDRVALPVPKPGRDPGSSGPVPPRTPSEARLAEIVEDVLGAPLGVEDDFFSLGGDSIQVMQVVARARRRGLVIKPRWFYRHRTVAALARAAVEAAEDQMVDDVRAEPAVGEIPLTPIQRWLFDQNRVRPESFCQIVAVDLDEPVVLTCLRGALDDLVRRHDALRLQFDRAPGGSWRQYVVENVDAVACDHVDGSESDDVDTLLVEHATLLRASFALNRAPLLRAVVLDLGTRAVLLVAAHHLVVDAVSWRLLLADLIAGYRARCDGQPIEPQPAAGFTQWARRLARYAADLDSRTGAEFWSHQTGADALPPDRPDAPDPGSGQRTVQIRLDAERTRRLQDSELGSMQDILVGCLATALTDVGGGVERVIEVELHGRKDLFDDLDPSQMVGWFTSLFPLRLPAADHPLDNVAAARARLEAIPHQGIEYGLLSSAGETPRASTSVSFTYLGQIIGVADLRWRMRTAAGVPLSGGDPTDRRPHPVSVVAAVTSDGLTVDIDYGSERYHPETIRAVAVAFSRALDRCVDPERSTTSVAGVPLSPTQAGLLFASLVEPRAGTYVAQPGWDMTEVDADRVIRGWQWLFNRHSALRTGYQSADEDDPLQFVADTVVLPVTEIDLTTIDPTQRSAAVAEVLRDDRQCGFDLARPPLARLTKIRLDGNRAKVVFTHHHLIMDGWSLGILLDELDAVLDGRSGHLLEAPPFDAFLSWQRAQDPAAALEFWRGHLEGARPTPFRVTTASGPGYREYAIRLGRDRTAALTSTARAQGLTVGTLMHGCWAQSLAVHGGTDEVVIGTTFAVRPAEVSDVERIVGPMISTVPLRVEMSAETPTAEWFSELQETLFDIRDQVPVPLGEIARVSGLPSGQRMFDTVVLVANYPIGRRFEDGSTGMDPVLGQVNSALQQPDIPLIVTVRPGADLLLKFLYDPAAVDDVVVQRLSTLMTQLITEVSTDAAQPQARQHLVAPAERDRILLEGDGPKTMVPTIGVDGLFAERVDTDPDAVAVFWEDGSLTYAELAARSNALAQRLQEQGVRPDTVVGVHLPRSVDFVIAALGITLAGGAYLALDPELPDARLRFMVADSGATIVVAGTDAEAWPGVTMIHPAGPGGRADVVGSVVSTARPDNLAYVCYTSGSTGTPKGVLVTRGGLANRLSWMSTACPLFPTDVLVQKTLLGFDIAVWELWWPLVSGCALQVTDGSTTRDPLRLAEALERFPGTVVHFVPSALAAYVQAGQGPHPEVRILVTGGESMPASLVENARSVFPNARIQHLYGPTETTIDVTWQEVADDTADPVPIGRPIANTRAVLLDRYGRPVPDGVVGELHLGGANLARGYVGQPGATAERFVPDPFGPPGARLYRSGDLARRSGPDGALCFGGRTDQQVKVRGVRVECGEIERALTAQPEVREAVVVTGGDGVDDRHLIAYVTASETTPTPAGMRAALEDTVPAYVVPSVFVVLDALPLTPSGKIDRAALPDPVTAREAPAGTRSPRTLAERTLADIWATALGVERVDPDADFHQLGGHSLVAMRIAGAASKAFGVSVPVATVFQTPTVAGMAQSIDGSDPAAAGPVGAAAGSSTVPLSFAQQGLWLTDRMAPGSAAYNVPHVFRLRGALDVSALWRALNAVADRHEVLRTRFVTQDGLPRQVVEPMIGIGLAPEDVEENSLPAAVLDTMRTPFDLGQGPLLRCRLLRAAADDHVLVLVCHHIISDGRSRSILVRDLSALYRAFVLGVPADLAEIPCTYADFSVWQRHALSDEAERAHLEHWQHRLAGARELPPLRGARPRPDVPTHAGGIVRAAISAETTARLSEWSRSQGVTFYTSLLAAYQALLGRLTDSTDIIVGAPLTGRVQPELQEVMGPLVNMVPLRLDCSGDPTFAATVRRARGIVTEAFAHQDLPFERLVSALSPDRRAGRSPLVHVVLQELSTEDRVVEFPGLAVEPYPVDITTSRFDLSMAVRQSERGADLTFAYSADLYDRPVAEHFVAAWCALLERAVEAPNETIFRLCDQALAVTPRPDPGDAPVEAPTADTPLDESTARETLRTLWTVLLELEEVSDDGHFFRLGGHSLLATQLCARIMAELGVDVPMSTVFAHPRLGGLAVEVVRIAQADAPPPPPIRPRRRGSAA